MAQVHDTEGPVAAVNFLLAHAEEHGAEQHKVRVEYVRQVLPRVFDLLAPRGVAVVVSVSEDGMDQGEILVDVAPDGRLVSSPPSARRFVLMEQLLDHERMGALVLLAKGILEQLGYQVRADFERLLWEACK